MYRNISKNKERDKEIPVNSDNGTTIGMIMGQWQCDYHWEIPIIIYENYYDNYQNKYSNYQIQDFIIKKCKKFTSRGIGSIVWSPYLSNNIFSSTFVALDSKQVDILSFKHKPGGLQNPISKSVLLSTIRKPQLGKSILMRNDRENIFTS